MLQTRETFQLTRSSIWLEEFYFIHSLEVRMISATISRKTHFHIHWSMSSNLDWKRFNTIEEAERKAAELASFGETYTIEQRNELSCERCGADAALSAWTS
jgi:hypothetical protein